MINVNYAKKYCRDDISKIENYDIAVKDLKKWVCHHRLEKGICDISKEELKGLDLYFHRPCEELIFLELSEHRRLHTKGRRKTKGEIEKIKKALKGKKYTQEQKDKLSKSAEKQKKYIKCIETGEILCGSEWRKRGFDYARKVANGQYSHCKGKHFTFITQPWERWSDLLGGVDRGI